MKAAVLIKNGDPYESFEIREVLKPSPKANEVLIEVEAFGLNYADVLTRLGNYPYIPEFPVILGYEVVGRIVDLGSEVREYKEGERVVALTRNGGYAEFCTARVQSITRVPDSFTPCQAAAIPVQYGTAYYMAMNLVQLQKGDHVLIQAAAGGLGNALTQLAKRKGCVIYGAAGSEEKVNYLRREGVDYPIDYVKYDFYKKVKEISGKRKLDVVFDPLGGSAVRKGMKLLAPGGKLISYGTIRLAEANFFQKISFLLGAGMMYPFNMLMESKTFSGVNMFLVNEEKPHIVKNAMASVVELMKNGEISPSIGGRFKLDHLDEAHALLESRESKGKIVVILKPS